MLGEPGKRYMTVDSFWPAPFTGYKIVVCILSYLCLCVCVCVGGVETPFSNAGYKIRLEVSMFVC